MVKTIRWVVLVWACTLTGCEIPFGGLFIGDSSVDTRFEESMELNRSHPQPDISVSTDRYSVLMCADLHLHNDPRRFSRFLRLASQGQLLFSSIVGDYVYELGASVAPVADSLRAYPSLRFIPVVGNHEVYQGKWDDYKHYFGSSAYYFSVKGKTFQDLFIVLDTGNGTLGKKQLEWLRTVLPVLRVNHRHCVVLTHNNFFRPSGSLSMTALLPQEELYALLDLFARHRVDMVFTGHDHEHDVTVMKGVTYVALAAMRQDVTPSEMCSLQFNSDGTMGYTFINSDLSEK